jgi:CHAT domain-containing protein
MRRFLPLLLLSLASLPASAQTAREAVAHPELSYAAALEALDRGNGTLAITMLDASIAGLPSTAHLALHERLLRLAEAYVVLGVPDSADVMLDRAREEMELMADSTGWELSFGATSDERLLQLLERVATAGQASTAFRVLLLRDARAGHRGIALDTITAVNPSSIPAGTALVSYLVSGTGQRVLMLVATQHGLRAVPLSTTDAMASRVVHLWTALAAGSDAPVDAELLSRQLIVPLLERMPPDVNHLAFVPGGPLRALPFDVLPISRGRRLVQAYETSVVPSVAQALAWWSAPVPRTGIRVVGFGYSGGGARAVGATAVAQVREVARYSRRGEMHVADSATESAFRHADLRSAGAIHMAVPVRATSTSDGGDELELVSSPGEDGLLDVDEAAHLRLGPTLVLMTGCPTRREPDLEGPPVPAMARALFQSGARSVVRCSWGLSGTAADRYVMALYEAMAAGAPIGAASRAAKLQLLQSGAGPSQWAAFELLGDARLKLPLDRPGASLVWWFAAAAVAAWIIWWSERRHRRPEPGPSPMDAIG